MRLTSFSQKWYSLGEVQVDVPNFIEGAQFIMKKVLSLVAAVAMAMTLLVACKGDDASSEVVDTPEFVDGTYRAEMAEFNNGYKEFMEVTYENGVITSVVFDAFSEKDPTVFKSTLTIEEYPMFDADGNDFHPAVWYPELMESVKNATAPEDIALIADATHSCENARDMFAAIQEQAKAGDTTVAIIGEVEAPEGETSEETEGETSEVEEDSTEESAAA